MRVSFYTLLERKALGHLQLRLGPNKPRLSGLFVPFADALKLIIKEPFAPYTSNKTTYSIIPLFSFVISCMLWILYPSMFTSLYNKYSILLFLVVASLSVFILLGAGWSRNRKYSLLGAIRAVAQTISYEIVLSLIIVHSVLFYYFNLTLVKYVSLTCVLTVMMCLLFITSLAETNRSPFDFSEGESELVSGFNTEYSAIPFILIFLAEYMSILFISFLVRALYNIRSFFDLYLFFLLWALTFIWCRGTLPRFRYDQLIYTAWKCFLPFVLTHLLVCLNTYTYSEQHVFYTNKTSNNNKHNSFCIMREGWEFI